MDNSASEKYNWFNPLTKVIIFSIILYVLIGIYIFGIEAIYYGKVFGVISSYMSALLFPITVPINSITLYFQRLDDPYTGHVWEWTVFASAFLALAIPATVFTSITSKNSKILKISYSVGIPLVFIWIIGSILIIIGNSIR